MAAGAAVGAEFQYSSTSRNCRNSAATTPPPAPPEVSVLFNESKLPKCPGVRVGAQQVGRFSTLQRVEIAEMEGRALLHLCRASFSTLQRVEIAEIDLDPIRRIPHAQVSVLFNESKLPKCRRRAGHVGGGCGFSTLQRVEIAEMRSDE